jgi:hypothetical protein
MTRSTLTGFTKRRPPVFYRQSINVWFGVKVFVDMTVLAIVGDYFIIFIGRKITIESIIQLPVGASRSQH